MHSAALDFAGAVRRFGDGWCVGRSCEFFDQQQSGLAHAVLACGDTNKPHWRDVVVMGQRVRAAGSVNGGRSRAPA